MTDHPYSGYVCGNSNVMRCNDIVMTIFFLPDKYTSQCFTNWDNSFPQFLFQLVNDFFWLRSPLSNCMCYALHNVHLMTCCMILVIFHHDIIIPFITLNGFPVYFIVKLMFVIGCWAGCKAIFIFVIHVLFYSVAMNLLLMTFQHQIYYCMSFFDIKFSCVEIHLPIS